ncbi:hypothetical protein D5b_00024 [Faustovirus]|nr:hypothetical protein D5b_00024 [Faustovirus]AMN84885.1 hypothetical protein D6_00486 [Faustovirus]AMP43983.1 hypothetical protein PRJ_Dakar_00023 [Faustovirus]
MFAFVVFCGPVIVGAWWQRAERLNARGYKTPLREMIGRKLDIVHLGGVKSRPTNASIPTLPNDILRLIACQNLHVYGKMLRLNKSLNKVLREVDIFKYFVEIIESPTHDPLSPWQNTGIMVEMVLKDDSDAPKIRHGESVVTYTIRKHMREFKRESRTLYYYGDAISNVEYEISTNNAAKKTKLKSTKYWRRNNQRYKRIRYYNTDGSVYQVRHYRDDEEYSPSAEFFNDALFVISIAGYTALIGSIFWYRGPRMWQRVVVWGRDPWVIWHDLVWLAREFTKPPRQNIH